MIHKNHPFQYIQLENFQKIKIYALHCHQAKAGTQYPNLPRIFIIRTPPGFYPLKISGFVQKNCEKLSYLPHTMGTGEGTIRSYFDFFYSAYTGIPWCHNCFNMINANQGSTQWNKHHNTELTNIPKRPGFDDDDNDATGVQNTHGNPSLTLPATYTFSWVLATALPIVRIEF